MGNLGIAAWAILIANGLITYNGFRSGGFFDRYKFEIDGILVRREYIRMLSSGFLHANWPHFIFNMISLYFFSDKLEAYLGSWGYLAVYFNSLLAGNFLALYMHRRDGTYSAIGASGAVAGVIFAAIALFPEMGVGFFGIPVFIPGWIYGVGYVLYSIYGIQARRDNIGHEAHLGGAVMGVLSAVVLDPSILDYNLKSILAILIPFVLFIALVLLRPELLVLQTFFPKKDKNYTIEDRYNAGKKAQENEVNRILDKISRHGVDSLTKEEKNTLDKWR